MEQFLIFFLFTNLFIIILNQKNKQLITKEKWVEDLYELAKNRKTFVTSQYPYYYLYYELDSDTWYLNSIGLQISLFNGRNIYDFTNDKWQEDFSNTGRIMYNRELFDLCDNISTDFKELKEGEPRLLFRNSQLGVYLGKEIVIKNAIYNSVHTILGRVSFSWVDSEGRIFDIKGGGYSQVWEKHGIPSKWVKY